MQLWKRVLPFGAVPVLLSLLVLTATPANADGGWRLFVGQQNVALSSISCPAINLCFAVGSSSYPPPSLSESPVIETLHDDVWQTVSNPVGSSLNGQLNDISCVTSSFCKAVGFFRSQAPGVGWQGLIESFNGTSWSVDPSPNLNSTSLYRVSCASETFCMAVGTTYTDYPGQSLVAVFNGSSWSIESSPSGIDFGDISCASVSFCMALAMNGGSYQAEMFNGSQWSSLSIAAPSNSSSSYLYGLTSVSCVSSTFCVAVGGQSPYNSSSVSLLAEEFNGTRWSVLPTPSTGPAPWVESTVTCSSTTYCEAVGYVQYLPQRGPFEYNTVLESFNGSSWSVIPNPPEPFGDTSNLVFGFEMNSIYAIGYDAVDVSCPGGVYCVAVGSVILPTSSTTTSTSLLTLTNKQVVSMASGSGSAGYWAASINGGVFSFGSAGAFGSVANQPLAKPIVGMAATSDGKGYWEVASDGGVFTFGDAGFYGSMAGQSLAAPVVGVAATPDGKGYWLAASDGGVFTFGDAGFYGSMAGQSLAAPVVGMAATADGKGYWEVASDGGVFTFGDAGFYGSMAGQNLAAPVVGMAATADGKGYWLAASDGGIFSFGDAVFYGSMGGQSLAAPVVGMAATSDGKGYWEVASDGGVFTFGDAGFFGSA
jgi:hypothetical protein